MRRVEDNELFFKFADQDDFDAELMLSLLLEDGALFASAKPYLEGKEVQGPTIVLFVNCNDVFVWGCADAEPLPYDQIPKLYKMVVEDSTWGASKWCCIQRNQKPQKPVVEAMKANNSWNDILESLPENKYDKIMNDRSKNNGNV